MECFGVVAEFNPFHDGHAYFIDEAKKMTGCGCCIAAMSGDFTQRGEPAIFDKWERAEAAVRKGADLVVEIPQVFACSPAPLFAKGGVGVLAGLGICSHLAFGSESGSVDDLLMLSEFIEEHDEMINDLTGSLMKEGLSYPKAREKAVSLMPGGKDFAAPGSNDILAVEYLRQDLGGMTPVAVKRKGAGHTETASAIRDEIIKKDPDRYAAEQKRYFDLVAYKIMTTGADELEDLLSSGSGLGYKLKKEVRYAKDLDDLIDRVKSKVYTRTRITRLLTHIILGVRKEDAAEPGYVRVLAMNGTGAEALRIVKKNGLNTLPVISNINKDAELLDDLQKKMISFDIMAGDVYNIIKDRDRYDHSDYVKSPVKA